MIQGKSHLELNSHVSPSFESPTLEPPLVQTIYVLQVPEVPASIRGRDIPLAI